MKAAIKMAGETVRNLGFNMRELMSGEHEFEQGFGPEGTFQMQFDVRWGPGSMVEFLDPRGSGFMVNDLEGTVTIGGLCYEAPCRGSLKLDYLGEHRITYDFDFLVGDQPYNFVGQKVNIKPWNLPVSHTTCFGVLKERGSGRLVSRSVTFFKMGTLPRFLTSFRLSR